MAQEIGKKMHLTYIDQNTPIFLHTNNYNYNIPIHVGGICFVTQYFGVLGHYHNIAYIHLNGYISKKL
jgi:hypothetical protein